jgi:hypothetical protein
MDMYAIAENQKINNVLRNGQNLQLMENGILKEVNKWVNYLLLTALV